MALLVLMFLLPAAVAGALHGFGSRGLTAFMVTQAIALVAFYGWFKSEAQGSANANALAAWPMLLIVYLGCTVLSSMLGIAAVRLMRNMQR